MDLNNFKQIVKRSLLNIPGWRTNRKIVVFESDDWGSIRMPSKDIFNSLIKLRYKVDACPYMSNDSLASKEDLDFLFELLKSFKDYRKNHPIITSNILVANPDFDKIRLSGFKEYHYELITETFKSYPKHNKSFSTWLDGIDENVFLPQFHGREHFNPLLWLELLKTTKAIRNAFDYKVSSMSFVTSNEIKIPYLASYLYHNENEFQSVISSIKEGLRNFENLFSFSSISFIAPLYIWSEEIEKYMAKNNVRYIQGNNIQKIPELNKIKFNKKRHYIGQKNIFGQIYLVRNAFFEPTLFPKIDSVDNCLKQISLAFSWKKPAIISTHRLNYIGYINPKNRDANLIMLRMLITKIIKEWPEVEFMSTVKLGNLISNYENI